MREWILAFGLGVLLGGYAPGLPSSPVALLLLIPWLVSLRFRILRLGAAFCLGLWWLFQVAIIHAERILPTALEQVDLWVRGEISGLPQHNDNATRFSFLVSHLCLDSNVADCDFGDVLDKRFKLLLNDYSGQLIQPGQSWQFKVRLKRPNGFANPGGFDYERWLFRNKIAATGYVREDTGNNQLRDRPGFFPGKTFDQIRYEFQRKLADAGLQSPGFLSALTIGDRYLINDSQWNLLSRTGTNHLMVISGLHISLVAWMAFHATVFFCRLLPQTGLFFPAPRVGALTALFAAFIYAGLAGFNLPVQRALVMVSCLMSGKVFIRQSSPVNNLCLALLLVLLLDPLAPQSGGFWLSFMAVACLLLSLFPSAGNNPEGRAPLPERLIGLCRSQAMLFLGLFPVMAMLFQQVSLLAPIVNLVAIPFIGLLVVPLCLGALIASLIVPGLFPALVSLPDFLLSAYSAGLESLVNQLGFLQVSLPAWPLWITVLLLAALLLQVCWRCWYANVALLMVAVILVSYRPERPGNGEFFVDVLDVGQGLSVVITTRDHLLVYDTGPAYSPRFNAGSGIIQPFLSARNLGSPGSIVVSHGDNDHAGGLEALVQQYPQAKIISSTTNLHGPGTIKDCRAGQSWHWEGVDFEFLHPLHAEEAGNNGSCVLMVRAGNYRALLPGDIEDSAELSLVRRERYGLRANILIAPHHGSKTSSTTPLVRFVTPDYVVFPVGYLNRFNHPHPRVLERYQRQGVQILDTASSGHLHFRVSASNGVSTPQRWRELRPRFWSSW